MRYHAIHIGNAQLAHDFVKGADIRLALLLRFHNVHHKRIDGLLLPFDELLILIAPA